MVKRRDYLLILIITTLLIVIGSYLMLISIFPSSLTNPSSIKLDLKGMRVVVVDGENESDLTGGFHYYTASQNNYFMENSESFDVANIMANTTHVLNIPDIDFSIPRRNFYLGVGGYNYNLVKVDFYNKDNKLIGSVKTWGGTIFLPNLQPGKYYVRSYGEGKILLALDLQNSNEIFSGKLSRPTALFISPFDADGIHIKVETKNMYDKYKIEIYNQSLDKVYENVYSGSVDFDFYFPKNSKWNDLSYVRIIPMANEIDIRFSWYSLKRSEYNSLYMYGLIIIALILSLIVIVRLVKK